MPDPLIKSPDLPKGERVEKFFKHPIIGAFALIGEIGALAGWISTGGTASTLFAGGAIALAPIFLLYVVLTLIERRKNNLAQSLSVVPGWDEDTLEPVIARQIPPIASPNPKALVLPGQERPPAPKMVIADITASELFGFFNDRTVVQAKSMTQPYLNKWIKVSGKVNNVVEEQGGCSVYLSGAAPGPGLVFANSYDPDWIAEVEILKLNAEVTVLGCVAEVGQLVIFLEDCELVHEPPKPTYKNNPELRTHIIGQLESFIREAHSRSNEYGPIKLIVDPEQTYDARVKRFLVRNFDETYLVHFIAKYVTGLEEILHGVLKGEKFVPTPTIEILWDKSDTKYLKPMGEWADDYKLFETRRVYVGLRCNEAVEKVSLRIENFLPDDYGSGKPSVFLREMDDPVTYEYSYALNAGEEKIFYLGECSGSERTFRIPYAGARDPFELPSSSLFTLIATGKNVAPTTRSMQFLWKHEGLVSP